MANWLFAGAVNGLLTVALGAFGAHGLKGRVAADALGWWQTSVQYHGLHALALLAVGILLLQRPGVAPLRYAGALFLFGIVLFCGTLYAMALGAPRALGMLTPLGGLTLLAGWAALVWGVRRLS